MVQIFDVSDASLSASCGRVDDDTWSDHAGVEVPIPTPVLFPELRLIERNADVEVAHFELMVSVPPAPPHATPVFESTPRVENVAQPALPAADVRARVVVVAPPFTKSVPSTENFANGDVVPTPTFPSFATIKFVRVEEPTTN
jgi:hypothetical protein